MIGNGCDYSMVVCSLVTPAEAEVFAGGAIGPLGYFTECTGEALLIPVVVPRAVVCLLEQSFRT